MVADATRDSNMQNNFTYSNVFENLNGYLFIMYLRVAFPRDKRYRDFEIETTK